MQMLRLLGLVTVLAFVAQGCLNDDNQPFPGDECRHDADCVDDGSACTLEFCDRNRQPTKCESNPAAMSTVCDFAGGAADDGVCDASGNCLQCLSDANCN